MILHLASSLETCSKSNLKIQSQDTALLQGTVLGPHVIEHPKLEFDKLYAKFEAHCIKFPINNNF